MGIIYLGILLCSIAFAIVAIYLSIVLKRVANTVTSLGTSLGELEKELENITPQITETLQESNKLIDDISEKVRATDSVFDSADNVGISINTLNEAYKDKSKSLSDVELEQKMKPFVEGITWSEALVQLIGKWKAIKPETKNELMVQQTEVVPVNAGGEKSR